VRLLLEAGADANATALVRNWTAEPSIYSKGRTHPVFKSKHNQVLLARTAIDVSQAIDDAQDGKSPLHFAAESNSEAIQLLLDAGADVNAAAEVAICFAWTCFRPSF